MVEWDKIEMSSNKMWKSRNEYMKMWLLVKSAFCDAPLNWNGWKLNLENAIVVICEHSAHLLRANQLEIHSQSIKIINQVTAVKIITGSK